MGFDSTPLWSASLQKEAFDLMAAAWPSFSDESRARLIDVILAGPPNTPDKKPSEHSRRRRDREVFERLLLLERVKVPPLPARAVDRLVELRRLYPQWEIASGDRAHFTTWSETTFERDTDLGSNELARMSGHDLIAALRKPGHEQDGRLDAWEGVARTRPGRAIGLLSALVNSPHPNDSEIWQKSLFGLRNAIDRPSVARRVFSLLITAPDDLMTSPLLLPSASDLLGRLAKSDSSVIDEKVFWKLWDRLLTSALREDATEESSVEDEWLHRALNRPMGDLTTTLLDRTFRRGLKVGQELPPDLKPRFDQLVADRPPVLRLARVILASRLVYLFAIDRKWVAERLLPFFDWKSSEEEAVALWQGYGWQARINADLWAAIRGYFFDGFTERRLNLLGSSVNAVAEVLMVVGVELPATETPSDLCRSAIRKLPTSAREAALSWLANYIEGPRLENQPEEKLDAQKRRADQIWRSRVAPWLSRVWPKEVVTIEPGTSARFAGLAVATNEAFDDAVAMLLPYMGTTTDWGYIANDLLETDHPEARPKATLELIGQLTPQTGSLFAQRLRSLLDRVGKADEGLKSHPQFKRLDTQLRLVGK